MEGGCRRGGCEGHRNRACAAERASVRAGIARAGRAPAAGGRMRSARRRQGERGIIAKPARAASVAAGAGARAAGDPDFRHAAGRAAAV